LSHMAAGRVLVWCTISIWGMGAICPPGEPILEKFFCQVFIKSNILLNILSNYYPGSS